MTCISHAKIRVRAAVVLAVAGFSSGASAQVTPVTVTGKAGAYANIFPNPVGTMTYDDYFGPLGPYNLSEQQHSETSADLSCDVLSTGNGSVAASGTTGSATMNIHWVAVDNVPNGNPPPSGTFGGYGQFRYSFQLSSPMTLSVTVTTTSNGNGAPEDVMNSMAINHSLGVNNQFIELPLIGVTQQDYPLNAGFHVLLLEHYPNSGFAPWPATNVFAQTQISFQISAPAGNGDMNCSGGLTVSDIQPMVLALTNPAQYSATFNCLQNGDMNADGSVNGRDLQLFVDALVP
jgi:hypothetical protein